MLSFSQRNLEFLLEHLLEWILQTGDPEKWVTQWIYAVLACLILPLEPYVHSILREIAKFCKNIRNELKPEDEQKLPPLNLLISIIANVFNQLDLAD